MQNRSRSRFLGSPCRAPPTHDPRKRNWKRNDFWFRKAQGESRLLYNWTSCFRFRSHGKGLPGLESDTQHNVSKCCWFLWILSFLVVTFYGWSSIYCLWKGRTTFSLIYIYMVMGKGERATGLLITGTRLAGVVTRSCGISWHTGHMQTGVGQLLLHCLQVVPHLGRRWKW